MQGKIVEENGEKIFRELCNCAICKKFTALVKEDISNGETDISS